MAEGEETTRGMEDSPGLSPGPEPADLPDHEEPFFQRWHFEIKIGVAYIAMIIVGLASGIFLGAFFLLISYVDDRLGINNILFSNFMDVVVLPLRHDSLFTLSCVLSECLIVLIVCYFIGGRDIKKALFEDLGLRIRRNSLKRFAVGVAIGILMAITSLSLCYLMGYSSYDLNYLAWYFSDSFLFTYFSISTVLIFCEMLAIGIGEEIFFRGYLQRTIAGKYGILPGIVLAAGLFSITHGFGLTGLPMDYLGFLCFGIAMGCIYYLTGSLFTTIGFHFAWNFVIEESWYVVSFLSHDIGNFYIDLAGFRIGKWTTVIDIVLLGLFVLFYLKYAETQKEKREAAKRDAPALATSEGSRESADDEINIPFLSLENSIVKLKRRSVTAGTIVFAVTAFIALIPALTFFIMAGLAVAEGITPSTPIITKLIYLAIILFLLAFVCISIRKQLRGDKDENETGAVNEPQVTENDNSIRDEGILDQANSGEVIVAEPDSLDLTGPASWGAIIIIILLVLAISAIAMGYI